VDGLIIKMNDLLIEKSKTYFPNLQIKYKNESLLMKLIGRLLFFNKNFMSNYITTIGSTVYFPSRDYVKYNPISSSITLLHELVHIYDAQKISGVLFGLLYLFPQILAPIALLLFFISWKIALLAVLILSLPLPAYFRMKFEKRAYISTFYVYKKLGDRLNKSIDYDRHKMTVLKQFNTSSYYFMWIFGGLDKELDDVILKTKNNEKPYEDDILDIVAELSNYI
jgi:ABC-type multidrug transport system fused ATPase/permease subunit